MVVFRAAAAAQDPTEFAELMINVAEPPPRWYHAAACRDVDVSVFYPLDNDRGVLAQRRAMQAKQICRTCPVIEICRTVALTTGEKYGIWGGLTPAERRTRAVSNRQSRGS